MNLQNIVILMGCSSAAMFQVRDAEKLKFIEHDGIVLDYFTSQAYARFMQQDDHRQPLERHRQRR